MFASIASKLTRAIGHHFSNLTEKDAALLVVRDRTTDDEVTLSRYHGF